MKPPKINADTFPQLYNDPALIQILSLIGTGYENGIHASDIASMTNIGNRSVRKSIETIRRAGIVICSDSDHGYYFPASPDELEDYVEREERRARSTFFTLKAARRLKKKCRKG